MKLKPPRHSRRRFLGHVAKGAALSGMASALESLAKAAPATSSLSGVEHIVIFMQENRSFDHYLGTLNGVRGYGDKRALRQLSGASVFGQGSSGNLVYPYRLNDGTTSGQCVGDVAHDWESGLLATNGGRMDGWLPAKGQSSMSYHTRADIPYMYALADAFTLCDAYFCSVNGPTCPNRLYLMSGTVDPNGVAGGPVTDNSELGYSWTTYPERLQQAGVTWRVYQEVENFDDNALAWFTQFKKAEPGSPLYDNGMKRFPRRQFADDVANGKLPQVSWIIAPEELSEHANHLPNAGMHYGAAHFLSALAAHPSVWEKTIFIWNYDENGGFFDHVAPPTPPPGTPDEFVAGEAIGLGVRVPAVIISPWSRGGHVCSEVFDHTSVLRLLELWTGVKEPNISAWRRQVCGDLLSAFDFTTVNVAFPDLPDSEAAATAATNSCNALPEAAPNGETAPPPVEAGARSLRALPYRLSASLAVWKDEQELELTVRNHGAQGVALQLYHSLAEDVAPAHLALSPSAVQTRRLLVQDSGRYAVELRGPGGFVRAFGGALTDVALDVAETLDFTQYLVVLTLGNRSASDVTVQVSTQLAALAGSEQALVVPAQGAVNVSLATTDGWYDYVLVTPQSGEWRRELAGHIEGRASRTLAT